MSLGGTAMSSGLNIAFVGWTVATIQPRGGLNFFLWLSKHNLLLKKYCEF